MKLNSIRWRLTISYAAIALLAAFSLGMVLRTILQGYYAGQERQYLQDRAMQIGLIASQLIDSNIPEKVIRDQSKSWSYVLQVRVQIADSSGNVMADSGVPDNPQVFLITNAQSFQGPFGTTQSSPAPLNQSVQIQVFETGVTPGPALHDNFIFINKNSVEVAMPADVTMYGLFESSPGVPLRRSSQVVEKQMLDEAGNMIGKVILSDGPAYGDEILSSVMNGWIIASVVAVLFAALAGWLFSNRITTPLTELTKVTSQMSQGNLSARADVRSTDEIGVLGNSFNEMASQVEEMVGTLRSFVADAAHELHTPLTALQTNLELARDEEGESASTLYLSRAQEQGQRLEVLVKSLLELSRVETADVKSNALVVDLSQIIREIAEQFASRAEQSNRFFTLELPDEKIEIMGNDLQLHQVFVNLLGNAVKFTRPGDSIKVSVTLLDDKVNIEILDTGIGIPAEDLPHLFKRFHRGRNVSEFAGNGLGLAIVKAIVEGHGGHVDVTSNGVGEGSKFTVTLPTRL